MALGWALVENRATCDGCGRWIDSLTPAVRVSTKPGCAICQACFAFLMETRPYPPTPTTEFAAGETMRVGDVLTDPKTGSTITVGKALCERCKSRDATVVFRDYDVMTDTQINRHVCTDCHTARG